MPGRAHERMRTVTVDACFYPRGTTSPANDDGHNVSKKMPLQAGKGRSVTHKTDASEADACKMPDQSKCFNDRNDIQREIEIKIVPTLLLANGGRLTDPSLALSSEEFTFANGGELPSHPAIIYSPL